MTELVPFSRPLPWDILLLILSHAPNTALATLACVSPDLLAASTALLYRDVTIKSGEQLELLFCDRVGPDPDEEPSRINEHLSLHLIHNLTLAMPLPLPRIRLLSPDRLPSSNHPIPLQSLSIHIPFGPLHSPNPLALLTLLHSIRFLDYLNPVTYTLRVTNRPSTVLSPVLFLRLPSASPAIACWTRLTRVSMHGVVMVGKLPHQRWCGFLPRPDSTIDGAGQAVLRVDLDSLRCRTCPDAASLVRMMGHRFIGKAMGLDEMREGACVLVVKGEEEREEVRRVLKTDGGEWGAAFAVEVGNGGWM